MQFSVPLFILPIRDGNQVQLARSASGKMLFILPIRDGNYIFCIFIPPSFFAFYTSYKGWKRDMFYTTNMYF